MDREQAIEIVQARIPLYAGRGPDAIRNIAEAVVDALGVGEPIAITDEMVERALGVFIVTMQRTGTTREGLCAALEAALRSEESTDG